MDWYYITHVLFTQDILGQLLLIVPIVAFVYWTATRT